MAVAAHIHSVPRPAEDDSDKDLPLRDDIRLLGRILGDTVREQEGEEVYRAGRADPQGLDPLPSRQRSRRAAGARSDARQPQRRPDACRSCAPTAISRISPTSLKISITSAATAPMRSPARRRVPARSPTPFSARSEMGVAPEALGDFFDRALVSPVLTAHPTEVRRKSTLTRETRDRRIARRARPRRRSSGARGQRGKAETRGPYPLAHQSPAPDETQGHRRGRQRALVLRLHILSASCPASTARSRTGSTRSQARRGQSRSARSCGSARGSAAIATAIRSSPPTCSTRPCGSRARGRSATIWTNCTNLAPNCRLPPISPR